MGINLHKNLELTIGAVYLTLIFNLTHFWRLFKAWPIPKPDPFQSLSDFKACPISKSVRFRSLYPFKVCPLLKPVPF